jgi:hypothetical protein
LAETARIKRWVAEANAIDAGKNIARISKDDAYLLGVPFGGLVELQSTEGWSAYAKCYFIHPNDEGRLTGMIQIEGPLRLLLRIGLQHVVAVTREDSVALANSVTLELMDGPLPDRVGDAKKWLSLMIEEKPLWKDGIIFLSIGGKPYRVRVISAEPRDKQVLIGNSLTRIVLPNN